MGTISVSLPADGETIEAADYNTPVTTIVNAINGNLDNANISSGAAISGTKLADGSITPSKSTTGGNVETRDNARFFDHIASGCVWTADAAGSTRLASCTSGVVFIAGKYLTVAAVSNRTFTASKDVYCDLLDNGDGTAIWVYYDNTTNTASPSFATTTGTVRGAIVVVGASNIANAAAINQGQEDRVLPIASSVPYAVTDSLGNLICPRDPNRGILGYRQIIANFTGVTSTTGTQITGLTAPVTIPAGSRKIKITVDVSDVFIATSAGLVTLSIWDGTVGSGTQIGRGSTACTVVGTPYYNHASAIVTPSAGSKTYNVGLATNNAANAANIEASATYPAYIYVRFA